MTRVVHGHNVRSSLPVSPGDEPSVGLAQGSAASTQVSFQLVLPGPDDSPQISHHTVGPRRPAHPATVGALAGRPRADHPLRGRKKKFVPAPPTHPLLLSGKPLSIEVELIEVQAQEQPLFSLGVLERAAKRIGILLRLETCPAEDGVSWLSLDGIGRLPVSRIGGLVLIGFRMLRPGHVLLGCRGASSALVDTGAQVCLYSRMSQLLALEQHAYSGPPLRGADNAFVDCQSAATFTLHFDLGEMLQCLPRCVSVVTTCACGAADARRVR